jgi:tRNA-dihydrouridine synthase A
MQHCQQHLQQVDGVMLGREIYENPWRLSEVDLALFDQPAPVETREQALRAVQSHAEAHVGQGGRLHHVTRHVLGLYKGEVGGRAFRRMLSEGQHDDDWALVEEALDAVLAA